jgi:hypothetical protein
MVNFDDDAEGDFLMLGRKLLTVGRHVVSDATSEAALSAEFWQQAASIQREVKVFKNSISYAFYAVTFSSEYRCFVSAVILLMTCIYSNTVSLLLLHNNLQTP